MRLPDGVCYRPRQDRSIAKDQPAFISIETQRYPDNAAYQIRDHPFEEDIAPCLRGDWETIDERVKLRRSEPARSVAKYEGNPCKPSISLLPNLRAEESRGLPRPLTVFGCTMGHYFPPAPPGERQSGVVCVYEFQSYGMAVIDKENGTVELWVAQDGDKVAIPDGSHLTLYNLGDHDHPLVTLDFAQANCGPLRELAPQCGPILLAYYDDFTVSFVLNYLYVNNPGHGAGVRLATPLREEWGRQVRIDRGARLELGRLLYEQLTQNPEVIASFAQLGLQIQRASPEVVLEPLPPDSEGIRSHVARPLVDACRPGSEPYRYFFPESTKARPGSPQGKGIEALEREITQQKESQIQLNALNRRLEVVVEGAGDWVELAYRELFKNKSDEGYDLTVSYVDDTSWKGERPGWAEPGANGRENWEIYLDKADPGDFARYQNLRPDVVFVVTPDFTHAAIARSWLGKTPLVFVEKPFESQLDNLDSLLRARGTTSGTTVLGLDHYQAYALPVHELKSAIVDHLGGALARVVFYMTEDRPIELGRERSLQYGLTLDLLPHLPAMLTYFGDVGTVDNIQVIEAGQYDRLIATPRGGGTEEDIAGRFPNETASKVHFTFEDYSGNGYHVPCLAVVGKGFQKSVKYLEIQGRNGNAIRVDLNRPPDPNPYPNYPWDSLFFLQAPNQSPTSSDEVQDPYDANRTLLVLVDRSDPSRLIRPLVRTRYELLLNDLLEGGRDAVASTLSLSEGWAIVDGLDRIWRAIQEWKRLQEGQRWSTYLLDQVDPVRGSKF